MKNAGNNRLRRYAMRNLKITIIGAGSSYTPEIIEGLAHLKERLPVQNLVLQDINNDRLFSMHKFCIRYANKLGLACNISAQNDRIEALKDADFVIVQIRVGGNRARILDEQIPLKYGVIGQETTGPGGFMKALRTVPVMLDIAKDVEKVCPKAWIINYTNPTGIVAEAINDHTNAKIAGLCAGGFFPREGISRVLNVPEENIRYDYFGLNHLNFSYNVTINGRPLTEAEFNLWADNNGKFDPELLKTLRLIPSPYLKWYYNTQKQLSKLKNNPTRGERVLEIEKTIFESLNDENLEDKPPALKSRGGGGYSKIALGVISSIFNNEDKWMIINVPNRGTVDFLPDNAVIETACMVNSSGIKPLKLSDIPQCVRGLICAVKNYEQLTVKAALNGDIRTAILALMAHPLVRDYDLTIKLLDELLLANRTYLPRFFK